MKIIITNQKLYLILVITIYFILYLNLKIERKKEEISLKNTIEIEYYLENILKKRIDMLKNMNYNKWIIYNKENNEIIYKGKVYKIFLWEKHNNEFMNKVQTSDELENLSWNDTYNLVKDVQYLSRYKTDENLIPNMFRMKMYNTPQKLDYFWIDYTKDYNVKKERSIFITFKKDNIEGLIGLPLTIFEKLNNKNKYKAFEIIGKVPFFINFLIISIIIYLIMNSTMSYKVLLLSVIIFLIIVLYSFFMLNQTISPNHPTDEKEKLNLTAKNVSAIAFLSGVNIFIINKSGKFEYYTIYTFLFSGSIIILLMSLFQKINANNYSDIFELRSRSQYYYNLCIIYNILIILSFIVSYLLKN